MEATTGQEALAMIKNHPFDIILLDARIPDMDGCQVCQILRETDTIPILMLSSCTELKNKVRCFRIGADDFLTKSFDLEELLARMNALLRRVAMTQTSFSMANTLNFSRIKLHFNLREIQIDETVVSLTEKEMELLATLAKNSQFVSTRDELIDSIFGYDGGTRVIDSHIKNICKKLKSAGLEYNPIQTIRGVGYKFLVFTENE
ncbi:MULTISPECIES: response regulator transcription factor [unclassified Paenibacillus]|uniref:response regulator transcription factor n=1 Tax=unclassified Paenibacillus TaxID=185978 RepID=UPI00211B5201|nr:response regulator transcription factor [Paenibacillus sp. PastF-3]